MHPLIRLLSAQARSACLRYVVHYCKFDNSPIRSVDAMKDTEPIDKIPKYTSTEIVGHATNGHSYLPRMQLKDDGGRMIARF